MISIHGEFIALGDTHFFDKNFNIDFFENQMKFYEEQLFPYMEENNIKYIIQTGDLFDNRTTINIHLFNLFTNRFCDYLKEHDITMISFLGNHDIVFRNTRDFNMTKYLEKMYPDNIKIIQDQTIVDVNGHKVGMVPWLLPDERIDDNILLNSRYIIGHFELNGYNHSRNVVDTKSNLKADIFTNQKKVFSGHYHLNHSKGKVHYLGTPYQSDFGDYGNDVGFYHFKEDFKYEFVANVVSIKYVHMFYDDRDITPMRMYYDPNKPLYVTLEEFKGLSPVEAKFVVECARDTLYEDFILVLKEKGYKFSFLNNMELESNEMDSQEVIDSATLKTTEHFILDYIKEYNSELFDVAQEILSEIESELSEGE